MDKTKQIESLGNELNALCMRYMSEFDLEMASVIGCLTIQSQVLTDQAIRDFEAQEDQDVIDEDDKDEGDAWKSK